MEDTQTLDLDLTPILEKLQAILNDNHQEREKRTIDVMPSMSAPERINFACPICGDSARYNHKKRGNIYLESFHFKCFNCGDFHPLIQFFELFDQTLDAELKINIIEKQQAYAARQKWSQSEFLEGGFSKLLDLDELVAHFNTNPYSKIKDMSPIIEGSPIYHYLNGRKIFDHTDIYQARYHHTPKWVEPIMVSLNQSKGRVLGMQVRNIRPEKDRRFYKIFTFSELYAMLKKEELSDVERIGYDKFSMLYNVLKIDWGRPITVFEGFLDTKFWRNALGCVGTNTDLTFLLEENLDLRFFYDNDAAGIKKAAQMVMLDRPAFLWEKFFDAWAAKAPDAHKAYKAMKKKFNDLNDLAKRSPNPQKSLELDSYFSLDRMDIQWLLPVIEHKPQKNKKPIKK